jgi:hypothetical protein
METILAQHSADDAATKAATTNGTLSTQEAAIESGKLVMHGTVNGCHGYRAMVGPVCRSGSRPPGHRGGHQIPMTSQRETHMSTLVLDLIILNPLLGFAVGTGAEAVSGALSDLGFSDLFMKDLAATMGPGSSALFVLVRKATPDKVLEEVKDTGGKVLKTPLSHENKQKLQAAVSAGKS